MIVRFQKNLQFTGCEVLIDIIFGVLDILQSFYQFGIGLCILFLFLLVCGLELRNGGRRSFLGV